MENAREITLENIIAIEVELKGNQVNTDIDFGSITLFNGDKSFILDVVQTTRNYSEMLDETLISLEVEIDKETFKEHSKFDLSDLDLLKSDTHGKIYFAMDEIELANGIMMYVKVRQTPRPITLFIDK